MYLLFTEIETKTVVFVLYLPRVQFGFEMKPFSVVKEKWFGLHFRNSRLEWEYIEKREYYRAERNVLANFEFLKDKKVILPRYFSLTAYG